VVAYVLVLEELSKACTSIAGTLNTHLAGCTETICKYGTEDQRKKFVPALAKGDKIGAFSVTESEAGSDISKIQTTARRDGDSYVLNGTKIFVTNGSICSTVLLFANVKELNPRGMTAFIVEKDTPGVKLGQKYKKLGMHAMDNSDIIYEDCRVPEANRLGAEGQGMRINLESLDVGRLGVAAQGLGMTQTILDKSVEYSKQRIQFGGPLSQNQGISFKLADMATGLEAARALTHKAASLAGKGQPFRQYAAMAKLLATEGCMKAAVEGIQIHGGYGYMMDLPMQRYFRDAKILEIYEGTSEIQRVVIAGALLR
ncbi:MAG: acyl-CoA dehydrogenase family protein, partial [Chloroflexi bacterium]|nr:acyl-CoA dehydrogenase family protein [Chloroflexota bacterium]